MSLACERFSRAVTTAMWIPFLISEKRSWSLLSQVSPSALPRRRRGSPPSTGTTTVSHAVVAGSTTELLT
jgi:hypothetical protein